MIQSLITFFADYLKGKPITDVLLMVMIGVFVWNESNHGERTESAHRSLGVILRERDENEQLRAAAQERNTDRIITALTGVKTEVKKIPMAAAAAADKLIDQKAGAVPNPTQGNDDQ